MSENSYLQRVCINDFVGQIIVFSDAHFWPGISLTPAYWALLETIRILKPAILVANGDIFDGARVSRFPRNGWESQPRMVEELGEVKTRMAEIRQAHRAARCIRTIGNHDIRFDRYLATHASEAEGIEGFALRDHLPEWQECMSIWVNLHTVFKHRYSGGIHAAYSNTLKAGKSIFTGHTHRLQVTPYGDYNGRRYGVETGSLASPNGPQMSYTEDNPSPGCSGFAVATFDDTGTLRLPELCEVLDNKAWFRGARIA